MRTAIYQLDQRKVKSHKSTNCIQADLHVRLIIVLQHSGDLCSTFIYSLLLISLKLTLVFYESLILSLHSQQKDYEGQVNQYVVT